MSHCADSAIPKRINNNFGFKQNYYSQKMKEQEKERERKTKEWKKENRRTGKKEMREEKTLIE